MNKVPFLVLLALFVGVPAHADKESSKAIYSEGKRDYNLGNFDKAIESFKAAYKEHPAPAYLYNIAQSYRQQNNCEQALFFYMRFLAEDPESKQAPVIHGYVAELSALCGTTSTGPAKVAPPSGTGTATVAQPDQGLAAVGYEHIASAEAHFAAGQFRDAAQEYEKAYQTTGESKYVYHQAESMRLANQLAEAMAAYDVFLAVDPTSMHAPLARQRRAELERTASALQQSSGGQKESSGWSRRKKLAVGIGAVGFLGLGAGSFFGLQAIGSREDALDSSIGGCSDAFTMCNATGVQLYEDAQGAATRSNIAFGVAVVASAAALTLWLTAPSERDESRGQVHMHPVAQPDAVGFVLSGEY